MWFCLDVVDFGFYSSSVGWESLNVSSTWFPLYSMAVFRVIIGLDPDISWFGLIVLDVVLEFFYWIIFWGGGGGGLVGCTDGSRSMLGVDSLLSFRGGLFYSVLCGRVGVFYCLVVCGFGFVLRIFLGGIGCGERCRCLCRLIFSQGFGGLSSV